MNVTLNACNVVKGRLCEGRGGILKSSRIKTNSSFTLVQKRHLSFLFPFFFYKQACHTGEVKIFLEGGLRSGEGDFQSSKNLKYWVVEEGLIVTLLNVLKKKQPKKKKREFRRVGAGCGHGALGGHVAPSHSGHSSGLGYVAGGQACQGHLHGGTLSRAPLSRGCFGGA